MATKLSLTNILEHNIASKSSIRTPNPVAVFVGGTSGIGEYTAYAFAKYTKCPTIYIVGRNATAGERIVEKLKQINDDPQSKYYFYSHDLTLIKECDKLCSKIQQNESKINLLFLSAGFLTTQGRNETPEGIDSKLSINYYSRWRIADTLMPLVKRAADEGENARVVTVLSPGSEGAVKEDDLDLKKNFSLMNANRHIVEFNSLAVTRMAKLYPNVGFIHAHPGIVKTGIARELPWYIRYATALVTPFATSPEDSAEKFYYMSYGSPDYSKGSFLLDSKLNDVKEKAESKGYLSEELQEKVWAHSKHMWEQAIRQ